jgi:uncharacterized protein (TIGR01777 family)
MSSFEKRSVIRASRQQLAAYHERDGALERLIPPWERVRVVQNDGPLVDGKRVVLAMKIGPVWKEWEAEHFDVVSGRQFRDRAIRGPFASWTHSHFFEDSAAPTQAGMPVPLDGVAAHEAPALMPLPSSELIDRVDYTLPFGPLGRIGASHIRKQLERMFAFRHARTATDLARHARFADRPRLKIAISGANGAIASNLIPFLTTAGHRVARLVRGRVRSSDDIAWNAETGEVGASMGECDAIVHLAGKNIATRWSKRNRDEIYRSRVDATRKLCESLAKLPRRPTTLVCASAVGFYGDRGEAALDESSPRGEGFVAEMCEKWERATYAAHDAGIRVVNLRTGVVISANTGAIAKLLLPAKFGMTGRLGSGKQWMPWIAMDDIVAAIDWCVQDESIVGPVNGVTGSVRQGEFMKTLGHVLHRPTLAPLPAFGVKTIFGQMGRELLLASANVRPTRLGKIGFVPTFATLEAALRFELGRSIFSS